MPTEALVRYRAEGLDAAIEQDRLVPKMLELC